MAAMKISEFRDYAHKLVGLPPDTKYPVLTPSQLSPNATGRDDQKFFEAMGRMAVHFLNSRKSF